MDLLAAIKVFVRLAEVGSFSAVARDLGVTQPSISRQVASLESHLGARLVHRTTRSMSITQEGRDFAAAAQLVLEALEQAETSVGRRHRGITGLVRVGAPLLFSRILLAPRIHRLLDRHPGLSVDLVRDDGTSDLIHDSVDIAIRVGDLAEDASYVARPLGSFHRVIVGSAAYLANRPPLTHPAELSGHDCILDDRNARPDVWSLRGADAVIDVTVAGGSAPIARRRRAKPS